MNRRLPERSEPNALARLLAEKKRARAGGAGGAGARRILDLTVTNPTAEGLVAFGDEARAVLADARTAAYEPDPRGFRSAREAIATAGAVALDPDRIFLCASTSEAYAHLFRLLCEPGDSVVAPRPSYPLLEPIARLEDVTLASYRLTYDDRWRLDVASLEAAVGPRTRAIVVVEPNNPTGSVLAPPERDAVESLAAERGLAIVSDEVFGEFAWETGRTLPTWSGERRAPTFTLGGLSKSCGLPQLKVAWIAASGPRASLDPLVAGLDWILDLFLSVGTPAQFAVPRLLAGRGAFQSAARARVRENLGLWHGWAEPTGAHVLAADGGWSLVVRLPADGRALGGRDADGHAAPDPAEWALGRCDVLLHPAHFYDFDDDRHVVASLLVPPADTKEALDRLREGMGQDQRG